MKLSIRYLFIASLLLFSCQIVLAYSSTIEKEEQKNTTLYWGDEATFGNYTIVPAEFSLQGNQGYVKLKLYRDGAFIDERVMSQGSETWNSENEIWIDILRLHVDPEVEAYVELGITLRRHPVIAIDVQTDADSYFADREIQVTVKIKNTGNTTAGDLKLSFNTSGMRVISGESTKYYPEMQKEEEATVKLTLDAPPLMEKKNLTIYAIFTGFDAINRQHNWSGSKEIEIASVIEINKIASGDIGYLENRTLTKTEVRYVYRYSDYYEEGEDLAPAIVVIEKPRNETEIYMEENAKVTIYIANHGEQEILGIEVNDTLPDEFKVSQLNEAGNLFNLSRGEEKYIKTYILSPTKPGTYNLPKACANWSYEGKNYSSESKAPKIVVNQYLDPAKNVTGPIIALEKSANRTLVEPGDKVEITITAANSGDLTCAAKIFDEIPNGTKLISGNLTAGELMKNGSSFSMSYIIEITGKETIALPPAVLRYTDLRDENGTVKSNSITLQFPEYPVASIPQPVTTYAPYMPAPADELPYSKPASQQSFLPFELSFWHDAIIGVLLGSLIVFILRSKTKPDN